MGASTDKQYILERSKLNQVVSTVYQGPNWYVQGKALHDNKYLDSPRLVHCIYHLTNASLTYLPTNR